MTLPYQRKEVSVLKKAAPSGNEGRQYVYHVGVAVAPPPSTTNRPGPERDGFWMQGIDYMSEIVLVFVLNM